MAEGEVGNEPVVWRKHLMQEEAAEFDNSLFFEYEFSIDQLMELAGLCVAQVTTYVRRYARHGDHPTVYVGLYISTM